MVLLTELLAIKLYEHGGGTKWVYKSEEEREGMRKLIREARAVGEIYNPPEPPG